MKHLSMHHIDAVVHRKVLVRFPVFDGKLCVFLKNEEMIQ